MTTVETTAKPRRLLSFLGKDQALYRGKLRKTESGNIEIPTLTANERDLSPRDINRLRVLTDEANHSLEQEAEKLQTEYDNFAKTSTDADDRTRKELELKTQLRSSLHKVFKDKFDFSKFENLPDSDPEKQKHAFLSHPMFRVAVEDSKIMDFTRTRDVFDKTDSNFLFGLFKIPFLPQMRTPKIGWMSFEKMFMERHLLENSKSRVSRKTDSSKELDSLTLVGFFPESFVGDNNPNSYTVYLVDRFKERFKDITMKLIKPFRDTLTEVSENIGKASSTISRKLGKLINFGEIKRFVSEESFKSLKGITDSAIMLASGKWLSKHEDYHREGPIPRVNSDAQDPNEVRTKARTLKDVGFFLKDFFETGAWEELRVDILALLDFSNEGKDSLTAQAADQIKEFVLAERTLRYATQNDVNDAFDAVVSQVLINWFVNEGAIDREKLYKDHVLDMSNPDKVDQALVSLKDTMKALEDKIAHRFNTAIELNQDGIKDLLEDTSLSDAEFKAKIRGLQIFKESKNSINAFMRYWANWHQDIRDINEPKIIQAYKGDIAQYEQETGVNANERIWAPELTEKAKPKRTPIELRKRKDVYHSVHPYVTSLRNLRYYLEKKPKASLAS